MWDREIEGPGRQDIVEVKPDIMDVMIFGVVAARGGTDSLYGVVCPQRLKPIDSVGIGMHGKIGEKKDERSGEKVKKTIILTNLKTKNGSKTTKK